MHFWHLSLICVNASNAASVFAETNLIWTVTALQFLIILTEFIEMV